MSNDCQVVLSRIKEQGVSEAAVKDLGHLRDLLEVVIPISAQKDFVDTFVPYAINALKNAQVKSEGINQEFRYALLSAMRALPTYVDALRPFVDDLIGCVFGVMREDVDETAAEAMQLFIDINKAFRSAVEQYVPNFLDFILKIANDFDQITKTILSDAKKATPHSVRYGMQSFRLLHDAPVMIVLIFQLHRRFINEYIPRFVPVVVKLLEVDAERPCCTLPEISSFDQIGNEPSSPLRSAFIDYISCQIKVLSFLAYIARGFAPTLREYKEVIPKIVIRLLSRCPPEGAPARKELLVAIRHILSTELRQAFLPHIETLMDEQLLLGEGYTAFYVFRPAAYSMLADLIHHVRMDLPPQLVAKVITIYSRALHDPTLPNGIQTMSIKLLLNLVDVIVSDRFPFEYRRIALMRILTSILFKFEWMSKIVAELQNRRKSQQQSTTTTTTTITNDDKQYDPFFDDPLKARPIPTDNVALDPSRDNIRDLKFQLKTMINGVKNLVLALRTLPLPLTNAIAIDTIDTISNSDKKNSPLDTTVATGGTPTALPQSQPQSQASSQTSNSGFTAKEAEKMMAKLFKDGLCCFDMFFFRTNFDSDDSSPSLLEGSSGINAASNLNNQNSANVSTIPSDEKDLMDQFAYIFSLLDAPLFSDVISSNMDFLLERAKNNVALVSIPQYFLAIAGISRTFAQILARNLMAHFEEIGSANPVAGAIVLRLFKLLFLAVSVYPEENEAVLQPHLTEIILSCFRLYPKTANPANYFILLRSLFRSIGGGRFDSLYKEVLPLLQTILEELSHLSPSTSDPVLRDMYVELCLTTPVRLSNLLPFLSYLMKPVLLAMQSRGDLVNQGLRTFELCLDNLTPDFLEPILAPVFTDLLACLWQMLRPSPANQLHAHTAIRLLGKLGGKARRFITTMPNHQHRKSVGHGLYLNFTFDLPQTRTITIPCDPLARIAMVVVNTPSRDLSCRQNAFLFLKRSIASIFASHGMTDSLELIAQRLGALSSPDQSPSAIVKKMLSMSYSSDDETKSSSYALCRGSSVAKKLADNDQQGYEEKRQQDAISIDASKQLFCEIICALIDAYGHCEKEMKEEISRLILFIYKYIAIVFMSRIEHPIVTCIDFDVLCDIIVEYATAQNELQNNLAIEMMKTLHEQYVICIPDKEIQFELKTFFLTTDKIISACFRANAWQRVAACRMISRLCDLDLSLRFFWHHEIRLIRGVLYVMKSLPSGMSSKHSEELTAVVFKVLRLSNKMEEVGGKKNDDFLNQRRQYFDQVMLALVTELSNPNEIVRDAVKASFQLLSDIQGCEVTDLLTPLKTRVYGPIFSKPLRALPLNVQIGYIDAITYCLSLRPPLLEINEELLRLLNEAIAMVDEDNAPLGVQSKLVGSTNVISLKIICIRLLSTCLSSSDFQQAKLHPLRNQIVAVFFKMLYARQADLVEVCRSALEQVMAHHTRLPTELLQNGLRPVLQSLGEPRHLSLSSVEGLRRILQLFSHFFKAEIGRKLLDHLHSWADQHSSSQTGNVAQTSQKQGMVDFADVQVITAIMDLFCLLPNCGSMFLGELVQATLQLENALKRHASSPFRPVLLKFMELYPAEAIGYLLDNFSKLSIVDLYVSLLALPGINKVALEMNRIFPQIVEIFAVEQPQQQQQQQQQQHFEKLSDSSLELRLGYLGLINGYYNRCASSIPATAIDDHANLIRALWDYLKIRKSDVPSALDNLIAKLVCDSTISFLHHHPGQIHCAFLLLQVRILPYVFDTSEMPSFYRSWLRKCSPERLKTVLLQWLEIYIQPDTSFVIKAKAIRMIILPLVVEILKLNDADATMIMEEETFHKIQVAIWHRDCRSCSNGSCVIAVEELQFTVSLLEVMRVKWPERLQQYQQRIYSFLFNRVQSLDCSVRYSSFYTLAICLIESNSPPKQVLQVFRSLLKAPTADIRSVLRQAFDKLLPYFAVQEDSVRNKATDLITRALTKDGYLLTLVMSLWQCISQHGQELIVMAPKLLVPLLYSFSRVGPIAFSTNENRQAPLDLVSTLYSWHVALNQDSPLYSMPYLMDMMVNGLIRLLCSLPDYTNDNGILFDRGLDLLQQSLSATFKAGGDASLHTLKLAPLERLLTADVNEDSIAMISSGIRLLSTCIASRSKHLVAADIAQLDRWVKLLMERASGCGGKLLSRLGDLLAVIFGKFNGDTMSEGLIENFKESLVGIISDGLTAGRSICVMFVALASDIKCNALPAEWTIPLFIRAFGKAVKDHISKQEEMATSRGTSQATPAIADGSLPETAFVKFSLIPAIEYGIARMAIVDFPRSQFLSSLQILWEHSVSLEIQSKLLELLHSWIVNEQVMIPSIREKVDFLLTPCKVEQLGDSRLLGLYLDIVYEIYSRTAYGRTELRSRLEGAFLRGLRDDNVQRHDKFVSLLDASIPCNLSSRLRHVFEIQRWELAGSSYWIPTALEILLRSAQYEGHEVAPSGYFDLDRLPTVDPLLQRCLGGLFKELDTCLSPEFGKSIADNAAYLIGLDENLTHTFWPIVFSSLWSCVGPDMQKFLSTRLTRILSNDDYICHARCRPSVIETLVESISMTTDPSPNIPSLLIAYVMKTYCCWYPGFVYLERLFEQIPVDLVPADAATQESVWPELVSVIGRMYGLLGETDYMFGAYRRGFLLNETNIALSFDQMEITQTSQKLIEQAMNKCRSGTVPFSETEFAVWEDRWMSAAKSLQQWDLLTEISRVNSDADMGLECLWRLADWGVGETHIAATNLLGSCPIPSPRSKFFEAFLALSPPSGIQKEQSERVASFQTSIEEAIQLALHEWISLPQQQPCPAHNQLLHIFQMLVEIQESVVLYSSLSSGAANALARPQFLADLKGLLTAWRERLPNIWDDMHIWSDILAWRQHVFSTINSAFAPLINQTNIPGVSSNMSTTGEAQTTTQGGSNVNVPTPGTSASGAGTTTSAHPFAYRGYHEMAWLINRFAHVARKNNMVDVCLSFLNRIYTLPNIEIQDAFLKLREQAKCYMASPQDLPTALEVVNATNLNYFSGLQKGEFFALKSVILSRLGMLDEANRVFAQAVQIDLNMGHGWAAWGRFNDQRFSQNQDMNFALNAINCYLQAATLFKAHKSRRFLARILWLLTFEDGSGSLGKSFEMYNHDLPTWYWVSFVPQLLACLSRQEQRQARFILVKIAKNYPQALYLPLRTFHEDCRLVYGSRIMGNRALSVSELPNGIPHNSSLASTAGPGKTTTATTTTTNNPGSLAIDISASPQLSPEMGSISAVSSAGKQPPSATTDNESFAGKHPIDSAEDLLSVLKTGYPLLALTMENVMEHIVHRLRSTVDEDFYRVLTSLIGEAYQHIMNNGNILNNTTTATATTTATSTSAAQGTTGRPVAGSPNLMMEASLRRVYTMICNSTSLGPIYKTEFEADFITSSKNETLSYDLSLILEKLFIWRAKLEPSLRRHPKQLVLDGLSRFLAEFEYHRYDDIEVPGQYLQMRDGNQDFVKIDKFDSQVPVLRRHGVSYRRLVIRGNDGRLYPFAVQNPAGRQTRREERILQLFRFLDVALKRALPSRRRNLYFHVPAIIPISAHVRLVADDPSFVSYEEILNKYCETRGINNSDEVFLYFKEQLNAALPLISGENPRMNVELLNVRTEIFTEIAAKIVPSFVLTKYMDGVSVLSVEKWHFRRDFTRQLGAMIFLNYVFSIGHRFLHKLGLSKKSAAAIQTEVLPMVTASGQISLIEIIPFRFTPNLQDYITPIGTEGTLSSSIVSCARSLAKADSDLSEFLSIFIRDELLLWYLNYCSMQQQQQQQQQQQASQNQLSVNPEEAIPQVNGPNKAGPVIGEIVENPFEKLAAAGIDDKAFFARVQQNCELVMKRAQTLSCVKEEEQATEQSAPIFQSVLDLISSATNPQKLAQMDAHWHPWF